MTWCQHQRGALVLISAAIAEVLDRIDEEFGPEVERPVDEQER
jgi:hypothetical protein